MKDIDFALQKLPPQNIEAEQSVLGAILIDNNALTTALEIIGNDDFYKDSHRKIFFAMSELFYKNEPIGCARIRLIGKKAKLERIALLKKYRGKGFGKNIVNYLIKYCKKKNIKGIYMNSQYYLMNYYKKFGFKTRGKTFMEAGIKHIEMYLNQVKQKE